MRPPQIVAARIYATRVAANLRLFVDANQIPIEVSRGSGTLGPAEYIEFYGAGLDTLTTDTHVYYLFNGTQAGLRVPFLGEIRTAALPSATPQPSPASPADNAGSSASAVWLNGISGGIGGLKEEKKEPDVIAVQPRAGNLPLIGEAEATIPTR